MPTQNESFITQLRDALVNAYAHENREAAFLMDWFRRRGKAIYFLFRKNLAVTNIQFAELLALAKAHLFLKSDASSFPEVQVLSVDGFSHGVRSIFSMHKKPDDVLGLYRDTLQRTILAEPFYGGCTLFIPPHLELAYLDMCAESGYIHSCGINIYSRLIDKAKLDELKSAIQYYLSSDLPQGEKCFFRPYVHEDFTKDDREFAPELKNGLDEVKMHLEKYHIGDVRLVTAIAQLKKHFKDSLEFPNGKGLEDDDSVPRGRQQTIWLMMDRGLNDATLAVNRERYLICYAQQYKNENAFAHFDENKPAWICHTTLPHSLAAAMINITRPWPLTERKVCALDPFSGSGTTWLESLRFEQLHLEGADVDPAVIMVTSDNLMFFAMSHEQLLELTTFLLEVEEYAAKPGLPAPRSNVTPELSHEHQGVRADYKKAVGLYEKAFGLDGETSKRLSRKTVRELKRQPFTIRILFYLLLRVRYRHYAELSRDSEETAWTVAFVEELRVLSRQLKKFAEVRKREEQRGIPPNRGRHSTFNDTYSASVTLWHSFLKECHQQKLARSRIAIRSASRAYKKRYDIIVTDPPYGFNTLDDAEQLAALYAKTLSRCIQALKDGGHLIICLPEVSYTGKKLQPFTHSSLISYQVLTLAEKYRKRVITRASLLPKSRVLFSPPYYWESERALRRTILHFEFRDR